MRKTFWTTLFTCVILSFFWIGNVLTSSPLPSPSEPTILYSTDDDLRLTFDSAIRSAKDSILVIIYSLRDQKIIHGLRKQAEAGISVTVICDPHASQGVEKKLGPAITVFKRQGKGLMHLKILVTDNTRVWIGSANLTTQSMRLHDNLVVGIYSPPLANMIEKKAEAMTQVGLKKAVTKRTFDVGDQTVEMWFLPDNQDAIKELTQLIDSAQKSIKVAMFTWTRFDLAEAIVKAHQRGIDVEVEIDRNAGKGVGAKVVDLLDKGGVPVKLSTGRGLLHHKMMLIDETTLVVGSANWTKSAFAVNDDCFVVLSPLQEGQARKL